MENSNDNKLNQQGNEIENQEQNLSGIPPQGLNRNLKIIIGVLIVLLVGAFGVAGYYVFVNKNISQNNQPISTDNQNTSINTPTPAPSINASTSPLNNNQGTESSLEQKIMAKYDASQVERKNPVIEYSLISSNYDFDYEGPINIEIKNRGKTVGSFQGYNGGGYIPVYANNDDLFIVSYCGGIGGMCRGDFTKYNFLTSKTTTIKDNTLDFFLTNDGKKLFIFTVADDWLTFKVWVYNFENNQMIDQSITLKCSILSNIRKNCEDLFLQNDQEIVYVPLEYDDVKIGDAYRLTMTDNLKATKFSIQPDMINQYNVIFPVSN